MKNNKHIVSYEKILGVQQKLDTLKYEDRKTLLGRELIKTRGVIYYLKEGRYEDANKSILELKQTFYEIFYKIKKINERNNN